MKHKLYLFNEDEPLDLTPAESSKMHTLLQQYVARFLKHLTFTKWEKEGVELLYFYWAPDFTIENMPTNKSHLSRSSFQLIRIDKVIP